MRTVYCSYLFTVYSSLILVLPSQGFFCRRFHVDKMSSAHVYVRLHKFQGIDDISEGLLEDCAQLVKANSIQGNYCIVNLLHAFSSWLCIKTLSLLKILSYHNKKKTYMGEVWIFLFSIGLSAIEFIIVILLSCLVRKKIQFSSWIAHLLYQNMYCTLIPWKLNFFLVMWQETRWTTLMLFTLHGKIWRRPLLWMLGKLVFTIPKW